MSDAFLTDLQPGDDGPTRRVVLQRWWKNMALAFKTQRGGTAPTSGGYLIDITSDDDLPTYGCAVVAWAKNAAQQQA